jgi:hypothetical protein
LWKQIATPNQREFCSRQQSGKFVAGQRLLHRQVTTCRQLAREIAARDYDALDAEFRGDIPGCIGEYRAALTPLEFVAPPPGQQTKNGRSGTYFFFSSWLTQGSRSHRAS